MLECQESRSWRVLVHADAPTLPQRPIEDGKVPASATAVLPMIALPAAYAARLKIGLHLDGKFQEARVRAAVLRRRRLDRWDRTARPNLWWAVQHAM